MKSGKQKCPDIKIIKHDIINIINWQLVSIVVINKKKTKEREEKYNSQSDSTHKGEEVYKRNQEG